MKAGWEIKALGEVCEVGGGNPAPQAKEYFDGGRFPFFRTSDVGRVRFGEIETSVDLLNDAGIRGMTPVPKGTILLPKSGASTFLNHRVVTRAPGFASSHLATVRAISGRADTRFVWYYLSTISAQDLIQDHSYPSLQLGIIKGIEIPLPHLDEQKRIVSILDAAFEGLSRARAHTETNLQNARELFGTTIQNLLVHKTDAVATVQTTLGEVCEICSGAGFPDKYQGHTTGEFPFFKVGDMNKEGNEVALLTANNYISEIVRKVLGAKVFKPDCIVFPKVGGAIATNKKRKIVVPSCVDNNVMGLWPIPEKIEANYLSWWLQGFDIYEFSNKAALPSITKATVSDWPLVLPPKARQTEIAAKLQSLWLQTEQLQSHYRAKLADLDALRQALLQKAFAGELT